MELIDFVIEAKIAGYASGGEGEESAFEDNAKGFVYESNGYRYVDKYYGFNPLSGTEIVFDINGKPIWSMNYFGRVESICEEPAMVYAFLKEAMLRIDRNFPFRGPSKMTKNDYIYENIQSGSMTEFSGEERISRNKQIVYKLKYHGGLMI